MILIANIPDELESFKLSFEIIPKQLKTEPLF